MKSIFRFIPAAFLLLLVQLAPRPAVAQDYTRVVSIQVASPDSVNPADPAFRAKYERISFGDNFSLRVLTDSRNNYYIVDLTKLPTKFSKVYFMNLVFKEEKVVNIDSDLGQDRIWFLSDKRYNEKEVTDLLLSLKQKTDEKSAAMSEAEQLEWLKTNDKYQ